MSKEQVIAPEVRLLGDEEMESENSLVSFVENLGEKYKLTKSMRLFFLNRLPLKSDAACARKIGISPHTVMDWKGGYNIRPDCGFRAAYDEFWEDAHRTADQTVKRLRVKAAEKIETLLDGKKTIYDKEGTLLGQEDDYSAISRGVELAMRWNRDWSDKGKDEIDAQQVTVREAFFDMLAQVQRDKAEELAGRVVVKELPNGT